MTLMDAQQYDEARARRRTKMIIVSILAALVLAWVGYHVRNHPQRHAVAKFLTALQHQDMEGAFAIWNHDPQWKEHPERYPKYGFGDFTRDWGPSGEWGIIKSSSVDCSYSRGSGVIVQATVNGRIEHAYVWVDKSDNSLHFSPTEIDCGNWWGWVTE